MIKTIKTIKKRLLPDKLSLQAPPQVGQVSMSVLREIRIHCSLHRLLGQRLRRDTSEASAE